MMSTRSDMGPNAQAGPSTYARQNSHQYTRSIPSHTSAVSTSIAAPPSPVSPGRDEPPTHVQAIHDFSPSLLASTAVASNPHMYLSFKNGEIIRVYARDPTGWWDGEIATKDGLTELRDGPRRGWFPSNYVREMGHDGTLHRRVESSARSESNTSPRSRKTNMSISTIHSRQESSTSHASSSQAPSPTNRSMATLPPQLQTLLHPVVRSLSLLDSAIHSDRKAHIQPAAACVISAIRAVLMATDCLNKDSKTLASCPALGKERKGILAELNRLVQSAKQASGAGQGAEARTPEEEARDFEVLAKSARSVFAGMKRFLQYANDFKVEPTPLSESDLATLGPIGPVVPSAESADPATRQSRTRLSSNGHARSEGPTRIQETFKMRAASVGDLRAARRRQSSPPPPMPNTAGLAMSRNGQSSSRQGRARSPSDASTPQSATFASSSSGRSSPLSSRSSRNHRFMGSMDSTSTHAHSPSFDAQSGAFDDPVSPVPPTPVAEKRLATAVDVIDAIGLAEDSLLSVIAAFIGHIHSHHMGSHPSSHAILIEMTRETIDCVRDLLTVVEAVGREAGVRQSRPRDVEQLRVTKDTLYEVASRLVEGVEIIGNAPFTDTTEEDYDAVKQQLLSTATATLRAGSECVRLVRICVPEGSDSFSTTPTPTQYETLARQSTPRPPPKDAAVILRDKVVGQRGAHTLSGLHRKASSLSLLHRKFKDGNMMQAPSEGDSETADEEEDEEIVTDTSRDEDLTLQPVSQAGRPFPAALRPPFIHTHTSPALGHDGPRSAGLLRTYSDDNTPVARSRSSSLTSPAPPRMTHRSPSRSADLDKFTGDYDMPLAPPQRPNNLRATTYSGSPRPPSMIRSAEASSVRSSGGSDRTTPAPTTPQAFDQGMQTPEMPYSIHLNTDTNQFGAFPKLGGLRIDTDVTPVKSLTLPRPNGPARSVTAPMPTASADVGFWIRAHDYDPRDITFNNEGTMVGASLTVLVEKMTPHDGPVEPTFWTTFFFTFRMFTTPVKLVDALVDRYNLQPPPAMTFGERERAVWIESKVVPIRLRIYNFLKAWLDTYWRSETDDIVLDTLREFNSEVVGRSLPAMAPRLDQAIRKRQSGVPTGPSDARRFRRISSIDYTTRTPASALPPAHGGLPPTPLISKSLNSLLQRHPSSSAVSITDFDTLELARQLTIMESRLFCQVAPEDLLLTGKKSIPELKALSTLSNQITGWVADNVLDEHDPKKRASLLKFYIKLADKCLMLNNFSTLFAVLAGLNSSIVLRLKKTWDALPAKYKLMVERLQGVIEHTKNSAAYRARLRDVEGPCLPFLGLILTDITFMSDGNPDSRPSTLDPELSLINQDKYNKLGKIAIDFLRYQNHFNFHELEVVQTFLKRTLAERGSSSLDALYRKSLMLEPRQGSEKISSAVEKPGWLGGRS